MAHSTSTTNYKLSQFAGTDKPAWLEDYNADMLAIDRNLKTVSDTASAASTAIPSIQSDLDNVEVTANSAETKSKAALSNQSDVYDATSTYSIGDMVLYNNLLYRCIKNINTAESFDGTKWERISVERITNDLIGDLNHLNSDLSSLTESTLTVLDQVSKTYWNSVLYGKHIAHAYISVDITGVDADGYHFFQVPNNTKPSVAQPIIGISRNNGIARQFNIGTDGVIRNIDKVPSGTYYFDMIWLF